TGINAIFISNYFIVYQIYFWKHFTEFICSNPMGGAVFSIQQTSACQQKGPNTKAGYLSSIFILLHDPRNKLLIGFHHFFIIAVNCGNYYQIGMFYFVYSGVGNNSKNSCA